MAVIGLRKPYIGKYLESDGTVSYTGGQILAKAIEFSAKIESTESNNLYADDGIAESDVSFAGGTFEITTDELTQEASALIMGMVAKTITVGADVSVSELVYDDDMNPPDLGFGIIIPKKSGGVYSFRAIVFPKVKFNIPEDSAKTQGETIEWQTPTIGGVIMRDGSAKRVWKREVTVETEANAVAYIKSVLNIS